MSIFKKKLTEQEAALGYTVEIINNVERKWSSFYQGLKEYTKLAKYPEFFVNDEKKAKFDLIAAAIALGLQAPKNLFPKDQAERLRRRVLALTWSTEDLHKYVVSEVKLYEDVFQEALNNMATNGGITDASSDPLSAIPVRLLKRWLGENIKDFTTELLGEKGIIDPLLIMMLSAGLTSDACAKTYSWKSIKGNFRLVEGDTP